MTPGPGGRHGNGPSPGGAGRAAARDPLSETGGHLPVERRVRTVPACGAPPRPAPRVPPAPVGTAWWCWL